MKQKVVRATITETEAQVTAYSKQNGIIETTVILQQTFKTEEGLEKAIREYLKHDDLGLVDITSSAKRYGVYEMPVEQFIESAVYHAEPIAD